MEALLGLSLCLLEGKHTFQIFSVRRSGYWTGLHFVPHYELREAKQ